MEKRKFAILVIDDDPADVEILRRLLEQIEGWKIKFLACNDARTGRAEALRCQVDLIFLDYLLGVETGLDVFHEMRKGGCTLPVSMFTGHGSEEVAVEAMKAGVSDYLIKGQITPDSLRLVISNAVQKFKMQQKIDEQRKALLDAERQRVMMESVAATCHHFAGPLTTMFSNLQMFTEVENMEESEKRKMLEQCLKAAEIMKVILNKFQQVREYRTRPFLDDLKILDIGLGSIYGTPGISEDDIKHTPGPENQ
jgi:DNA-binding response OmpR family regulator